MLEYQKAEQLGNPRVFGGVPMPQTKCEEGLRDLNARPPVKSANKSRKKKLRKNPRVFGGVPMPQTKCEEGLRELVALIERGGGANYAELKRKAAGQERKQIQEEEVAEKPSRVWRCSDAANKMRRRSARLKRKAAGQERKQIQEEVAELDRAYGYFCAFRLLIHRSVSQLIDWTEKTDSASWLNGWAGEALAELLRFLSSQEQFWRQNKKFDDVLQRFGDRRKARAPESYIAWLAGDYVRAIDGEWGCAALHLRSPAMLFYSRERKRWLKKLAKLPAFSPASADEWGEIVYQEMLKDKEKIMGQPEMHKATSYVGFCDFRKTILRAVKSLARKPRGQVRGVTRP